MRKHIVFLQITEWRGAWYSGDHCYGKLVNEGDSVDVVQREANCPCAGDMAREIPASHVLIGGMVYLC